MLATPANGLPLGNKHSVAIAHPSVADFSSFLSIGWLIHCRVSSPGGGLVHCFYMRAYKLDA